MAIDVETPEPAPRRPTVLFLVTEDWYFCSHRLALGQAAVAAGYRVVVATRVAAHGPLISASGMELRPLGWRRRGGGWRAELAAFGRIVALYGSERPDVVHHVALKPVVVGSLAACLTRAPRVVNALAGLGFVFTSGRARARLLRPFLRAALRTLLGRARSWVIAQNPDDAAAIAGLGVVPERIVTIRGSGVDTVRYSPSPEPKASPVIAAYVGRMLWDKGVGELVEAAGQLATEGVPVRIRLVGAPDPENPASIPLDCLRAWAASGVVDWTGPSDDVPSVWASAHIAVLASHREGMPRALLEAAACGRPLVATDVPGCRQVVEHEESGLLVPLGDVRALATALARLAADPQARRRMGARARARVEAEFTETRVVAETLALYERIGAPPRA